MALWAAVLFLADALIASAFIMWTAGKAGEHSLPADLDAGIVFFGGFDKDGGLNAETRRRADYAKKIFTRGRMREVAFVGGYRPGLKTTGAEAMRLYAIEAGLPAGQLTADGGSYDTDSNLESISKLAAGRNWRKIALISSAPHLFRIKRLAPLQNVAVFEAAYPMSGEVWLSAPGGLWVSAHHEWGAMFLKWVLTDESYRAFVRYVRS